MNWAVLVAALAAVIIFGGSSVATKVAVSAISAIDVSIMRTVIGGLIAMPLAIAISWDRLKPKAGWWLGCAIAFAGEVLLLYDPDANSGSASLGGDLLVWASTLFAMLLIPVAPLVVDGAALQVAGIHAWTGLLYQAIGVTIVAYILWYWALGTGGIAQVGLFQFLQPVSGVILAWLILAENLSLIFALASSIIMFGVILAFRAR